MTGPSYRLDYPCPSYLACVAVGRLQRVPAGETDGIPITYWGPAATPTDYTSSERARDFVGAVRWNVTNALHPGRSSRS